MYEIMIRHNFETAHRLPHIPGKCRSLHGHSWWAEITVGAHQLNGDGLVVEFGPFKKLMREWIDRELDHGSVLGAADPLIPLLAANDCKVFTIPDGWPTVEAVAALIFSVAEEQLWTIENASSDARILRVTVRETAVNSATWERP
jgi:6-pyruvoyltetrahydropterin/6-carboxytetrahydropterin synthase